MTDMHLREIIVPPALPCDKARYQTDGINNNGVVKKVLSGNSYCISGSYSSALSLYSRLKKTVRKEYPVRCYKSSRINREKFRAAASKLLVEIKEGKPVLEKFPEIPWINDFYPGIEKFCLSFPDLLGINGAWQWYRKGVKYDVLNHSVHPFYGVYFPTRTEHLFMFDRWLSENKGRFGSAIDVGSGSGVLSFIMAKHGIKEILATDINPNSIFSINDNLKRLELSADIKAEKANLLDVDNASAGLVVFNPPWIPGNPLNEIDKGIYFENGFFENFFDSVYNKTGKSTLVAVFFSNFARLTGLLKYNPVETELNKSNRFSLVEKRESKVSMPSPGNKNRWLRGIRKKEKTELWVLQKQ